MKSLFLLAGLLGALGTTSARSAPLLINGSFQSGSLSPGWQVLGRTHMQIAHGGTDADGFYDSIREGGIFQTFATRSGIDYSVSFFLASAGIADTEFGSAVGSGSTASESATAAVATLTASPNFVTLGLPAFGPVEEGYSFLATGPLTTLVFGVKSGAAGDPTSFGLDEIAVIAVDEPTPLAVLLSALGCVFTALGVKRRR